MADMMWAAPQITLVVVGVFGVLTAAPAVFKPYMHMSTFMSESLPDTKDEKTTAQLTLFWWMAQKTNVLIGIFFICSAFACPCLPLVGLAAVVFLARAGMGSYFMFGPPSEYMGINRKNVMPLFVLTFIFVAACVTAIFLGLNNPEYMAFAAAMEEKSPEKLVDYPVLMYFLLGVAGFFTLANLPAIFAPDMALASYFVPGGLSTEKYNATKFTELMRLNALGWTLLSLAQLGGLAMAPDLSVYGPMLVCFNCAFAGLFMYNIANAPFYSFQVPPALAFLFIISVSIGAAGMGLMLI